MHLLVTGQERVFMSKKDNRTRAFMFTIYPDDKGFLEQLDRCQNITDYAYIYHDQDLDSAGQKLKKHCHFVLYYPTKKSIEQVSEDTSLPINMIESYNSLNTALLYLVHNNQPDKHKYDPKEVYGTLKSKLIKIYNQVNDIDENEKGLKILNYINDSQEYITFSQLVEWCCLNGYFDVLRRGQSLFINLVKEHNQLIS